MKVTKHFGMGITGKFQSYRFETLLEEDYTKEISGAELKIISETLADAVLVMTMADIKRLAENDPEFRLVLDARQEELLKYQKYLDNRKKASE